MPDSIRVLHVIPSVSPLRGGPSQAIIEMVSELKHIGVKAEIATTNDDGDGTLDVPLNELTTRQGVPIRYFKRFSPPVGTVREFAYSFGFQRWLNKHIGDYDVVHVHAIFSFCSTYTMWLARKRGIPYMVRPIGQLEKWSLQQSKGRKSRYLNFIERDNLVGANCVQFTAQSEHDQAMKLLPDLASKVIPLGISIPMPLTNATFKMLEHWPLERGVPVIVYLSRLHPKKGLDLLLDALAIVDDFPFQLVIAGEGDEAYTQSLKDKSIELGLDSKTRFIGFVKSTEKNLLLQGADLFVLTSHSENFGIAVLEAMASGTAVLVSSAVALSEQISKHRIGFVCELDKNSIRREVIDAMADLENTQELGQAARDFVEQHYQWSAIANQLCKLYKTISSEKVAGDKPSKK